jgi:hypothetical protein
MLIDVCVYIYISLEGCITLHGNFLAIFFFWIQRNLTIWKAYFVGPGEEVKPRLSHALTRNARLDSNSRPAVQISNPLSSCYTSWVRSNTK